MRSLRSGYSTSDGKRPAATSCPCTCTGSWPFRACSATTRDSACGRSALPEDDEGRLIQAFFATVERYTPQLVSWNGGGFDLPVLHYRGLIHGVHAARYWELGEDDRDFRYNNYISRYHTRHIDLMDLLAMYQPRASAPLDDLAKLCGFAGKLGMDGSKVWEAFQAGGIEQIRNYCETDVVNTYLLYTRFQRLRGVLDEAACMAEEGAGAGDSHSIAAAALAGVPGRLGSRLRWPQAKSSRSRSNRSTRTGVASAGATARPCSSKAHCLASPCAMSEDATSPVTKSAVSSRSTGLRCCGRSRAVRTSVWARAHVAAVRCSTLSARAQVAIKQRVLEDSLWHIGRVRPERMLRPIAGPSWRYRHRARLTVRHVLKKGGVLVGFHERASSYVADMDSCEVLPARVSELLVPLRRLIEGLSIRDRLPQIEVAVADDAA